MNGREKKKWRQNKANRGSEFRCTLSCRVALLLLLLWFSGLNLNMNIIPRHVLEVIRNVDSEDTPPERGESRAWECIHRTESKESCLSWHGPV